MELSVLRLRLREPDVVRGPVPYLFERLVVWLVAVFHNITLHLVRVQDRHYKDDCQEMNRFVRRRRSAYSKHPSRFLSPGRRKGSGESTNERNLGRRTANE